MIKLNKSKWQLLHDIYISNDLTGPHTLRTTDLLFESKIYGFIKNGLVKKEPGGTYGTTFRLTPRALQLFDLTWN